jgi:hypothetical protein
MRGYETGSVVGRVVVCRTEGREASGKPYPVQRSNPNGKANGEVLASIPPLPFPLTTRGVFRVLALGIAAAASRSCTERQYIQ